MPKQANTFEQGLNMDISDLVIPNGMMRNCKNMRLLDLDGTSYAVTTIRGTEEKFTLSAGYIPIASVEYGDILYILSGILPITGNKFEFFELGSFDSPNYPVGGKRNQEAYAPFNNLDDGPFRVDLWDIEKDDFVDMSVQPDYDGSVNVIITAKNNPPRIINSRFDKDFTIIARRPGSNSNDYTSASVDTETRLILRSQKILNIEYGGIESGGKLQHGNYIYIFRYGTEDFNETDIVNQSGLCSVFEGYEPNKIAANVNAETTKRVRLELSNVDNNFAYIKVYFKYNTGEDSNIGRVFELTNPIPINGQSTLSFIHDGYEETVEISEDTINLDFTAFDSATSNTQANGYLLLGGVKEAVIDYQEFIDAAQTVIISGITRLTGVDTPHIDPENIYSYLSHFSGESYAFGIVFILLDGSLSPVFPVQGYDEYNWNNLTTQQQEDIKKKGIYRFKSVEESPFHLNLTGNLKGSFPKGVKFNIGSIPQSIKDKTLGLFFVRAERKRDLISQGITIPTVRVPSIDFTKDPQSDNIENYYDSFTNEADYKNFPILDNIVEPWVSFNDVGANFNVIKTDGTNRLQDGYMPSIIKNFTMVFDSGNAKVKDYKSWAYLSADYILNEARYITTLQRSNIGFSQWNEVSLKAITEGKIANKFKYSVLGFDVDTSLLYDFVEYKDNFNSITNRGEIETSDFVPEGSFSTGSDFVSGMSVAFRFDSNSEFQVRSLVDAYFGFRMDIFGSILDGSPYNQPDDTVHTFIHDQIEGPSYDNVDTVRNRAYLISVYPRTSGKPIDDINNLYDTVDSLSYHQVGDRISWTNAGTDFEVYGGDCYIGKIYKRLNLSGYDDPKEPSEILVDPRAYRSDLSADNINQGTTVSFVQECEYNPALRLPYLFKTSDPEKRTFYPFKDNADYNKYRTYRLHETNKTNQGYDETDKPKVHVSIPSNSPFIASNFFTRVVHSEKHVPNSFQNGYRSFVGINHEDYDFAMGEIVRLLTHRDQLLVIFEHGIGVGPISQRVQTGSDSAGAIFIEPSGVLPPNLSFYSRKIGAQHGNDIIQTPSSIYGIDRSRKKIWQLREGMVMISDMGFQYLLERSSISNSRLGYNPHYHEVIFTVNDWTLCFKEGLEKFTSFYSFRGEFYTSRAKEFYSFKNSVFNIHDIPVIEIYGSIEESYVEFVVNPSANITKVYDYINIVSNEISPDHIDLYTYSADTYKDDVLDESKMFQYAIIEQGIDIFTEEERIKLRDRQFIAQIPNVSYINDAYWSEGRMRNKYVIIRLTYKTNQKVELLSVITDFRLSAS